MTDLLLQLAELGLSSEHALKVLLLIAKRDAGRDESVTRRDESVTERDESVTKRDKARLRAKKYRENKRRVTLTQRDVPAMSTPPEVGTILALSKTVSKKESIVPLADGSPTKKAVNRKVRTAFPEGFLPKDPLSSWDKVQFEKFRLHHLAKGSLMASWEAAWGTWQRSPWYNQGKPPETSNVIQMRDVIHVEEGSPEMAAWDSYFRKTTGLNAIRSKHGGYYPPTRWPPDYAEATG
jgi:hypothetical protein